jgi:hypothetical protein
MSFKKYLALSVLVHFFLAVILIIPLTSENKIKKFIPKEWFLDASLALTDEKGLAISNDPLKISPDSMPSIIEKISSSPQKDIPPRNASDVTVMAESKTAKPENPALNEPSAEQYEQSLRKSFMSRVNNQFLLIKTKAFFKSFRAGLNALLNEAFSEDTLHILNGNKSRITITFDENGKTDAVSILPEAGDVTHRDTVYSNSGESAGFVTTLKEKVNWKSLPLPSDYALPYKGLNIFISVAENRFLIDIEPL